MKNVTAFFFRNCCILSKIALNFLLLLAMLPEADISHACRGGAAVAHRSRAIGSSDAP